MTDQGKNVGEKIDDLKSYFDEKFKQEESLHADLEELQEIPLANQKGKVILTYLDVSNPSKIPEESENLKKKNAKKNEKDAKKDEKKDKKKKKTAEG